MISNIFYKLQIIILLFFVLDSSALACIHAFIGKQDTINQATEQRFDSVNQRFTSIKATLKELLNIFKSQPAQDSSGQPSNHSFVSPDTQSPRQASTSDETKPKPPWAAIASKPTAPLTNRKRQALHRAFNPPANDSTQTGSYTFVYISHPRRMNRAQIRSKFREVSIDNLHVLDVNFPARNTIGVLLHEAYLTKFKSKLLDSHLLQDFHPLDHHHIAGRKYQDHSEEPCIQLAKSLHQDRCIRSLYLIRARLVPAGVAKYFVRKGWVSSHVAQDIINQRLPCPAKRRPAPQPAVTHTLQASQSSGFLAQTSLTPGSDSRVPPSPTLQD
ncbi:uncharacterized protein ATC70_005356 [Mucor velutinosus]|uniref:Uncharacterized protein n=1 Tax=Mucor velutinosus TaxID=708070 RepID=A0AAN7D9A5_9FUNG|nr:hypothetical protein ATC70_005356 [Mucor velutinosus]